MCTWAPTPRVVATFRAAFEHVLQTPGADTLIGSREAIAFAPAEWAARAVLATEYLGAERAGQLSEAVAALRPAGPASPLALNRDLWPRDEYVVK
jgi:hypothetical protein